MPKVQLLISKKLTISHRLSFKDLVGRSAINPRVMGGKPVIKGTRLTVEYVLNLLARGSIFGEILKEAVTTKSFTAPLRNIVFSSPMVKILEERYTVSENPIEAS